MKKFLVYSLLNGLRSSSTIRRKFKLFLILGLSGLLIMGTIAIWTAFAGVRYLANQFDQTGIPSPSTIVSHKAEAVQNFAFKSCWEKMQSLIGIQLWLENPPQKHLQALKMACFDSPGGKCTGPGCDDFKNDLKTHEKGELI